MAKLVGEKMSDEYERQKYKKGEKHPSAAGAMTEEHIQQLKDLFDIALRRCNCGGFCEECRMLAADFTNLIVDILNETESDPSQRFLKALKAAWPR